MSCSHRRLAGSRDALRYVAVAGGGILAAWAWIDATWFLAAWIGMFVLVCAIHAAPPKLAFRRAFCFGLAGFLVAFHWCPAVIADNLDLTRVTSWMLFLVLGGWNALQFGVFGYLVAKAPWPRFPLALTYPIVWVGVELVWPHVFPWRLGHSQVAWKPLIQLAEFSGVYGISFFLVWGAAAVAVLLKTMVLGRRKTVARARTPAVEAVMCSLALLAVIGYGHWRMDELEQAFPLQPSLRVAIVQPAVSSSEQMAKCRELSRQLEGPVDLICWPESSVGTYPLRLEAFDSPQTLHELSRFSRDLPRPLPHPNAYLLCAGRSYADDTPPLGPYYVTAFLVDKQERIIGRYHKRSLMPFGEYIPGEQWFPRLVELFGVMVHLRPGKQASTLRLPGGIQLGVLICYEEIDEKYARHSVLAGAQILCSLNNTSLFGRTAAVHGHQQLGLLRAVENRRYLLRCGTNGITSVISPTGRVTAQAKAHREATLIATVYSSKTPTIYARYGSVFAYGCLGITVIALYIAVRDRKQRRVDLLEAA